MSRSEARRRFTIDDRIEATPMAAQGDLGEIVHTARQVVCVTG